MAFSVNVNYSINILREAAINELSFSLSLHPNIVKHHLHVCLREGERRLVKHGKTNSASATDEESSFSMTDWVETDIDSVQQQQVSRDMETLNQNYRDIERELGFKGSPYLNVWSNFKDKKVVSYIPRATGHHHHHQEHRSRDDFKPTPTPSCHRESYKMKEMKRLKMAEMRACNNNLGV